MKHHFHILFCLNCHAIAPTSRIIDNFIVLFTVKTSEALFNAKYFKQTTYLKRKTMRIHVNIMWILYLLLLVKICETRKSRNKQRVKVQRSKDIDTQLHSMSIQELIKKICLPPQFNRLVYRYQNNSYIFIGFDDVEKDTVYSMTWKINKFNQGKSFYNIHTILVTIHV
jgi:hypothetical protein